MMLQLKSFQRRPNAADRAVALMGRAARHLQLAQSSTKTLGVVGFDADVQDLALRAHRGFGMAILVHSHAPVAKALLDRSNAVQVPLEDLLSRSDIVSLHAAPDDARPLMSGTRLDQMKPDAVLINAAEAELIDECALAQSLMFDTIAGAALAVSPCQILHPMLAQCDTLVTMTAPSLNRPRSHPRVA